MKVFWVLCAFAAIALCDLPSLIKNKRKKEILVFSIFLLFCCTICVLYALDVKLPSPMKGFLYFFSEVLHIDFPQ